MPRRFVELFPLAAFLGVMSGCANNAKIDAETVIRAATRDQLTAFESADALRSYAADLAKAQRYAGGEGEGEGEGAEAPSDALLTGVAPGDDDDDAASVTNVQEQGVDEGGIVKTHGDHLVILRRGRLFSIDLAGGQRRPVSMVDVPPPGGGHATWYDEMLIHGDTIVVVGYSYGDMGTELDLFDIGADGRISRRATHYLRSGDYYSSRNYASRLVGDTLVFYMPLALLDFSSSLSLPAQRRNPTGKWDEIALPTEIYRPIQRSYYPVLHTVVSCDLTAPEMDCEARGVIGPAGRNFYVSTEAVYVWVSREIEEEPSEKEVRDAESVVYRLPLDGSEPGALHVFGVPTDQFSFKERDDNLYVLVRSDGGGEWMWNAEGANGEVALMGVPIDGINTNVGTVREAAYSRLPRPGQGDAFQNRFVGDYVLYGSGDSWGYSQKRSKGILRLFDYRQRGKARTLTLKHGVDRIEALGEDAMIVGSDGNNLHFSSVALDGPPALAGHFVQRSAAQGELRSHGFFFKPSGDKAGVLGLPIRGEGAPGSAHLDEGSAAVLFLDVADLRLKQLGKLLAESLSTDNDDCMASCVDWYGNARPLFYRGRVFALLGYELVEGQLGPDGVTEIGRTDFLRPLMTKAE